MLRFWDLRDMSSNKILIGKMRVNHADGDALTALCVNSDASSMVTTDSAGRIKLFDVTNTNWLKDGNDMSQNMRVKWFIQAHKQLINSVRIVETFRHEANSDQFILTAGNDCNILLHRLKNGQKVGQFG